MAVVLLSLGFYVLLRSLLDGLLGRILFTIRVSQLALATLLSCLHCGQVRGDPIRFQRKHGLSPSLLLREGAREPARI